MTNPRRDSIIIKRFFPEPSGCGCAGIGRLASLRCLCPLGVRVRVPSAAPTRRKRHIACDELFIKKLIAHSFCCSSLPNATRCAGLAFGESAAGQKAGFSHADSSVTPLSSRKRPRLSPRPFLTNLCRFHRAHSADCQSNCTAATRFSSGLQTGFLLFPRFPLQTPDFWL